jgi:hypothetical protein
LPPDVGDVQTPPAVLAGRGDEHPAPDALADALGSVGGGRPSPRGVC